jgi:hypothetical protein
MRSTVEAETFDRDQPLSRNVLGDQARFRNIAALRPRGRPC